MKILQCNDSYYPIVDGVTLTVRNYTYWFNQKYGKATLLTSEYPNYTEKDEFETFRTKAIILPKSVLAWPAPLPFFKKHDKKILKRKKFDLVHTHSPFTIGKLGLRIAKRQKIPVITTFHSKYYQDFLNITHSKFISQILLKYVIHYYNKVDYVWTVNKITANTLREYGYKGNIKIMPNGVDFKAPVNKHELREKVTTKYSLNKDDDILLFVGQHNWKKNIRLIFEALAIYKKSHKNFILFMVGTGEHEKLIWKLAKDLDIDEKVIFTGKILDREELIGLYCTADILIFPSMYDTAGLVVKEAAICKTPSIVVKNSGASEGITHNVNGFLCEESAESLSKVITQALLDKDNLKEVSINAAETIPISWEKVVGRAYKEYEKIRSNK